MATDAVNKFREQIGEMQSNYQTNLIPSFLTFQDALIRVEASRGKLGARPKLHPELGAIQWTPMGWAWNGVIKAMIPEITLLKGSWELIEVQNG